MHVLRSRFALPALTLLLGLVLLAPTAARADDQSFATTAIDEITTLGKAERSCNKAVSKVRTHSRKAISKARTKIATVRRVASRVAKAVGAETTSTDKGAAAKATLLKLLKTERSAYATLDDALVQLRKGRVATANRLSRKASDRLRKITAEARELGRTIGELAAAPAA